MQPENNRREHRGKDSGHKSPPSKDPVSKPSGKWRKKYDCKSTKGKHPYELSLPHWRSEAVKHLSVEEYYDMREEEQKRCEKEKQDTGNHLLCCMPPLYIFECVECGKRKWFSDRLGRRGI